VASVDKLRVSEDGKIAYATVGYDREANEIDGARDKLEEATTGLNAALSGEVIDGEATGGFPIGEVIGLAIAVILLIAVLRNMRAARNALGAAFAGLGFGFAALMWLAAATDVPGLAPTLAGMLGLGAGRSCAAGTRRSRPPAGRTRPRATPRWWPRASCSSRSQACSSPGSPSSGVRASPPGSSCWRAP
jgi:RND superfamily putative drug exporter